MGDVDIRWKQRFDNFNKAFLQLDKAVSLSRSRTLSELEEQGLIQSFEYAHELAWKTLKDFIQDKGTTELFGSKDTTREAFQLGLISDGQGWMNMIKSRNLTSHTYNIKTADEVSDQIKNLFHGLFIEFQSKMKSYL